MNRTAQIRSLLMGTLLTTGVLLSSVTHAHISLMESSPAANTIVTKPNHVSLFFNEPLVLRASRLNLHVMTSNSIASNVQHRDIEIDIELADQGKTLRATPHHPLDAGIYHVQWRAVGSDNHPMNGEFHFTVK